MVSDKDRKGWLMIGAVAVALAAVFAAKLALDGRPKAGQDNCVGHVSANTVIVLDQSEATSGQTVAEITARAMAHIRDHTKVNERVTVFTVSELSKSSLKPVISLCKPPEDGSVAIENVAMIKKHFHDNFEVPIAAALNVAPGNSRESPIAQAITDISLSQYLRGESNALLVFSDMLENTSAFSLYHCSAPSEVVARYRESRHGSMERPTFKNTAVALNLIPRLDQSPTALKCRDQLWTWFFGDNAGAQAGLTVDYLPGGDAQKSEPPAPQ